MFPLLMASAALVAPAQVNPAAIYYVYYSTNGVWTYYSATPDYGQALQMAGNLAALGYQTDIVPGNVALPSYPYANGSPYYSNYFGIGYGYPGSYGGYYPNNQGASYPSYTSVYAPNFGPVNRAANPRTPAHPFLHANRTGPAARAPHSMVGRPSHSRGTQTANLPHHLANRTASPARPRPIQPLAHHAGPLAHHAGPMSRHPAPAARHSPAFHHSAPAFHHSPALHRSAPVAHHAGHMAAHGGGGHHGGGRR
jgi:hypothetical protein